MDVNKICKLVLAFCHILLNLNSTIKAQSYPWQDSSFAVVFVDEFTGTTLDQSKWLRRFPWGPGYVDSNKVLVPNFCPSPIGNTYTDVGYREYNYADTNFLKISNGTAKILSKKQNVTGETWSWPGGNFTVKQRPFKYCTSMLFSKYKFKYGYFEIKFKLPSLPTPPQTFIGNGPNFWLFNADHSLNNYWSEIDIFEIHGYNNVVTNNIIYQSDSTALVPNSQPSTYNQVSANTWHTAGAYWTPDNIEIYFDGQKINQINNLNIKPDSLVEMPLIIDINVPTHAWCEIFDSIKNVFPYTYEIDYVKVWQRKEACDTTKTYCSNFNPQTYNSKIYQSVTVGGSGCNSSVANCSNLSVLGANYVLLDEGFSIDNNSNVLLDVKPCIGTKKNNYRQLPSNFIEPPPPSFFKRYK